MDWDKFYENHSARFHRERDKAKAFIAELDNAQGPDCEPLTILAALVAGLTRQDRPGNPDDDDSLCEYDALIMLEQAVEITRTPRR